VPTPIDPHRLPGLKAALARFGEDEKASQQQLADLYGVTSSRFVTLSKKRFPDFPAAERHEDRTHWFPARAAVASMVQYMEDQARGKTRRARRAAEVVSQVQEERAEAAAAPPQIEPLSPAELDRLASAQTRIWKLRKEQGLYVLAVDVQRIARGLNTMLTREVMGMVSEIDPNGEMSPRQREVVKSKCRDIVLKMHDIVGRFLEGDDAGRTGGIVVAGGGSSGGLQRRRSGGRGADMAAAG
jgi:hypothetical protein